ncbi:MAG: LysR family transcriptional regulator [Pseudomonadota bacterium]
MDRSQFSDLIAFMEVARSGGFRSAAENLNLTPGAVSSAVKRFEKRLGVRLFERSTRSVALTTSGKFLFSKCEHGLSDISAYITEVNEQSKNVSGELRISAPRRAGHFFLDELTVSYAKTHPDVKVELIYDDSKVDLVSAGVDIVIRAQTILDESSHAIQITKSMPMTIVGSPKYLETAGMPRRPTDLVKHDGICFAFEDPKNLASWDMSGPDGVYSVMPTPRIIVNDIPSLIKYCEAGLGLSYIFAESVETSIKRKKLVPVLKKSVAPLPGFSLSYLSKRHMPRRVREFIEMAKGLRL